ncbi:hypothetical protein OBBRIDRAFT_889871 [Obba rivulosa]|uniref:WD40 repeat-like protein n=1 Tax=Obba rivulosa TaxID=1052685 RepID=A0A8E2AS17_9APHY|nr:hypothetical protein OBBRIDRAFT_889871 [Obba rivulosa]
MYSNPLTVPLSLPLRRKDVKNSSAVETAVSLCSPSCQTQWGGFRTEETAAVHVPYSSTPCGIALGCEDGSVFLFHAKPTQSPADDSGVSPKTTRQDSGTAAPLRHLSPGRATPRSASPSPVKINFTPFQVSRSRIVSSVSSEQVEAPKNYVDFEEETEKLKRMLKGKGAKERTPDEPRSSREGSASPDKGARSPTRSSSAVPTIGSVSKEKAISTPPSPHVHRDTSGEAELHSTLSLRCHIIPPQSGHSAAVSALKVVDHDRYMVCLYKSGRIAVHSTIDGLCLGSVNIDHQTVHQRSGQESSTRLPVLWNWSSLDAVRYAESNIIVACASREDSYISSVLEDQELGQQARMALFELRKEQEQDPTGMTFIKIGEQLLDGPLECLAPSQVTQGLPWLVRVSSSRHLVLRSIDRSNHLTPEKEISESTSSRSLPLPNPFKALASLSKEQISDEDDDGAAGGETFLGEEVDLGNVPLKSTVLGLRLHNMGETVRVLAWSQSEISVLDVTSISMKVLSVYSISGVRDAEWITCDSFVAVNSTSAATYVLVGADANNGEMGAQHPVDSQCNTQPKLLHSHPLPLCDVICLTNSGDVFYTDVETGQRRLQRIAMEECSKVQLLWKARSVPFPDGDDAYLTSALPIELDLIILGFSDGHLGRSSLSRCTVNSAGDAVSDFSDIPLNGYITSIFTADNERTEEKFLVGGADDGSIAVWALESLKLRAQWVVFTEPLTEVMQFRGEAAGRMRGSLFCVSRDGTVAVVTIDGLQFLYILPASVAPLQKVCIGGDNLLLVYTDHRARLWDARTREFWRSMNMEKADEMLKQGGWVEWAIGSSERTISSALSVMARTSGVDAASSMLLDMEALLRYAIHPAPQSPEGNAPMKLMQLRSVLSALLTFGVSDAVDQICQGKLGATRSQISPGCSSHGSSVLYVEHGPASPWNTSPEVSAIRLLALLAILQVIGQYEDLLDDANTVTGFYAGSLGESLGPLYTPPSLPLLARTWLFSTVSELRQAARVLFDVGVIKLSDTETMELVEHWQDQLPSRRSHDVESIRSATALFICGFVAVEKYTLLPTNALTDVAKSIALYLHDEASQWRALAIELCSRGFAIWQQHVDAVEMLRALFTLATSTRKDAISPHNIGVQARSAVLQIATNNPALFMTTLTIDILHPRTLSHRKSILQLVIFLIRKKPLTLYSNLPRLVEAVVKSLDPNSTVSRDAVLDSATEILGHVVRTYPTVDFHMATQRLAVGTSEGAVVMYDLKTATRLYVLEGHKKRTTACSFSPDGRRLVTLSLEESLLLVWKVGSSFSSFFNPGAPPRQGHTGSEPYKTLSFNIGEEAHMTLTNTLEYVQFEWPTDRSVKVKIRQSTLTFST